jgi:hypothetical protein
MTTYPAPSPPYVGPVARNSGTGNKPIKRIVLHGTVSPTVEGGARKIAAYFRSSSARGSAHYVVDPGEVVQAAYDSVVCWHAPPNPHSIGIELCDWVGLNGGGTPLPLSRWDDEPHTRMLRRAARLTAQLCLAYDVPVRMISPSQLRAGARGICEHDDVSKAWHQSSHWDLGNFPRQRFVRLVEGNVRAIKNGTEHQERTTRVTRARDLLEQALRNAKSDQRRAAIREGLHALPEE